MRAVSREYAGAETIQPPLANSFFRECLEDAGSNPQKLKALAMLHLHEVCDWTMEELGQLFEKNPGTICRKLQKTRNSLRVALEIEARQQVEQQRELTAA